MICTMRRENFSFSLYVFIVTSSSFKTSILRVLLNKYKSKTSTDKLNHLTNIKADMKSYIPLEAAAIFF